MKISLIARYVFVVVSFVGFNQAHADVYTKKMDFNLAGWNFEGVGNGSTGSRHERASGWMAHLSVGAPTQNWSAVGREFKFPDRAILGRSTSSLVLWTPRAVPINIEVINPETWKYIAVSRRNAKFGNANRVGSVVSFPAFTVPIKSVYFRVAVLGDGVQSTTIDVDDMTFEAIY